MAGFSKIYCLGGLGGFNGADGLNPLAAQILVGDADRQWLEPRYYDKKLKPIGKIQFIIPEGPNNPNMLIDACLAFFSNLFEQCPSLEEVKEQSLNMTRLDFNALKESIPQSWTKLRKEAEAVFKNLIIFEANLKQIDLTSFSIGK